jgi:hypothetical protein
VVVVWCGLCLLRLLRRTTGCFALDPWQLAYGRAKDSSDGRHYDYDTPTLNTISALLINSLSLLLAPTAAATDSAVGENSESWSVPHYVQTPRPVRCTLYMHDASYGEGGRRVHIFEGALCRHQPSRALPRPGPQAFTGRSFVWCRTEGCCGVRRQPPFDPMRPDDDDAASCSLPPQPK